MGNFRSRTVYVISIFHHHLFCPRKETFDKRERREEEKLKISARTELSQCLLAVKVNEVSFSPSLAFTFNFILFPATTTMTTGDEINFRLNKSNYGNIFPSLSPSIIAALSSTAAVRCFLNCFHRLKPKKFSLLCLLTAPLLEIRAITASN